jgi:anthranilate phosphoribosyltransferase
VSSPAGVRPTWPGLLHRLLAGQDLTSADTSWAMREVMTGEATPVQVAAFAVALRAKGESAEEVAGLAAEMIAQATPVDIPVACVDIVGTGGDGAHTVRSSPRWPRLVVAAAGGAGGQARGGAPRRRRPVPPRPEPLGVVIDLPAARGPPGAVQEAGHRLSSSPPSSPRYAGMPPGPRREMASERSSTSSGR